MDLFWNWWQNLPANIDPIIFQIGSFRLQYYGLMYLVAFGLTYGLAIYRIHRQERWALSKDHLQGFMTALIIGVILGARLGYVLFYNFSYYLHHPLEIILPFEFANGLRFTGISGMSYHGGLIGTILAAWYYIRQQRLDFRKTADFIIPCIPLGYTFGRLGNFINGELWGRVTTSPIGMHFPFSPDPLLLRHPSQLYEAVGEGIVLFIVLWLLRNKFRTPGALFSLYLIGYGSIRYIIEYFREPDAHMGFIVFAFSMGQLLCMAMITAGVIFWVWSKRTPLPDISPKHTHRK
jgi:phosphatidylglycerol:prolipoprotein diacylglycerol transferase